MDDISEHISESNVSTVVSERELFVIQPNQMKYSCMEIVK